MKRWGRIGGLALLIMMFIPAVSHAAVNNFVISDYKIDYRLGKNNDGRSTLRTLETITAEFPSYDQNHGIERAIPRHFDGHSTGLRIESVTDQNNDPLTYTTRENKEKSGRRGGDGRRRQWRHGDRHCRAAR